MGINVSKYKIRSGETKRVDCPLCGGKNTFTVTNTGGNYIYNCYRASCELRGRRGGTIRLDGLVAHAKDVGREDPIDISTFVACEQSAACMEWLTKYHSLAPYKLGKINAWYDVAKDRLVFGIADPSHIMYSGDITYVLDYMGRALWTARSNPNGVIPKWKRYGKTSHCFICPNIFGDNNRVVLVEDCFSACAVSELACGMALLGTTLHEQHIIDILKLQPKEAIVCLDNDAQKKSLDIANRLRYYIPNVRIVCPPNDLKYYDTEALTGILNLERI